MKILGFACFFLATLSIGLLTCMLVQDYSFSNMERQLRIKSPMAVADVSRRALIKLRSGNSNTREFLEIQLDVATIEIGNLLQQTPEDQWMASDLQMLAIIKAYRDKYPRKSMNAAMDSQVAQALSITNLKHGKQ